MRSYRRPSTHCRTAANTCSAGFRSVGRPHLSRRLPLGKSRMVPYHALHPCWIGLRLNPHLFHPLQSLPSSQHPQRLPSLGYPNLYLLLVELVKHFCWMLPSHFQWPCYTYLAKSTSHRKWHNSALLHSESGGSLSLRRLYRAAGTAWMDTRLARSMPDKPQPLPPLPKRKKGGRG